MRKILLILSIAVSFASCSQSIENQIQEKIRTELNNYAKMNNIEYTPLQFSSVDSCYSQFFEDSVIINSYLKLELLKTDLNSLSTEADLLKYDKYEIQLYATINKPYARKLYNRYEKKCKEIIEKFKNTSDSIKYYMELVMDRKNNFQPQFNGYKIKHNYIITENGKSDTINQFFRVDLQKDSIHIHITEDMFNEIYDDNSYFIPAVTGEMYDEYIEALNK